MVLFTIDLVAARGQGPRMAAALRTLSTNALTGRTRLRCLVTADSADSDRLHYVEEWMSERDLWSHIRSDRFQQLVALIETATERPRVSVQLVSRTYGLEYIQDVLKSGRS